MKRNELFCTINMQLETKDTLKSFMCQRNFIIRKWLNYKWWQNITLKLVRVRYKWFRMQLSFPGGIVFVVHELHPLVHHTSRTSACRLFAMLHYVLTNVCERFDSCPKYRRDCCEFYIWDSIYVETIWNESKADINC